MLYYSIVLFTILAGLYLYIDDKGTQHDYKNDYMMWVILSGLVYFLLYFVYKTEILSKVIGKRKFSSYQSSPHMVVY